MPFDPHAPRLTWTNAEKYTLANELVRQFPTAKIKTSHVYAAQGVLPENRRKTSKLGTVILNSLRAKVTEVREILTKNDNSTEEARGDKYDKTSVVDIPKAELVIQKAEKKTPPFIARVNGVHPSSTVAEELVSLLIEINQQILFLKRVSTSDLQEATRNIVDANRVRNLIIQANNGLSFFEEVIRAAILY